MIYERINTHPDRKTPKWFRELKEDDEIYMMALSVDDETMEHDIDFICSVTVKHKTGDNHNYIQLFDKNGEDLSDYPNGFPVNNFSGVSLYDENSAVRMDKLWDETIYLSRDKTVINDLLSSFISYLNKSHEKQIQLIEQSKL